MNKIKPISIPLTLKKQKSSFAQQPPLFYFLFHRHSVLISLTHYVSPPPPPSLTQGLLSGCREEVELSEVMDDYQPSAVSHSAPPRFTQPPTTRHENQSLFIFLSFAHSFFSLCYLSIYFLRWLLPSSIILSFFVHW